MAFLFEPRRYKIAYGGRGGLKSYSFADALLIQATRRYERVLCARENMNSIRESVHHTLESRIHALGLQAQFEVRESTILGPTFDGRQNEFIFSGLRHNAANLKSLEGVTTLFVEEAQNVSRDSWDTVIPTIRWEDKKTGRESEIWIAFNPKLAKDETYKRFVINPPTNSIVVKTDYRDNPWLPEVLRIEMEDLKARDYEAYLNVWMGECVSSVEGAIFGAEIKDADESGRIGHFPVDRMRPVDTFWDLGFGDLTAIWFVQMVDGWFHVIDYLEDSGKTIADYVIALQNKNYMYGQDWLPHDAVDAIIHARLGGDKTRSIEQLMRAAGRNVRVAPKLYITDRINAARTIFTQCRFNSQACADGIQGLRHYSWGPANTNGEARTRPLHNWASHPSDAFCTFAVSAKQPKAPPVRQERYELEEAYSWMS